MERALIDAVHTTACLFGKTNTLESIHKALIASVGFDDKQVLKGDTLNKAPGACNGKPLIVYKNADSSDGSVVAVTEGIHQCLAKRPSIEFGDRLSEKTILDFAFWVPGVKHFSHLLNGIKKWLIKVLVDADLCPFKHLECGGSGRDGTGNYLGLSSK